MEKLIITPKTKIYDLLEAWPGLEDTLIEMAPEFSRLKNPVLRRTIARVTTVAQAAIVGGLNVEKLVNALREKAGQGSLVNTGETAATYVTVMPGWYKAEKVVSMLDIRETLNRGEQPVHEVLSELKRLETGSILGVIAPFLPAPLIDKATGLGFMHWVEKKSTEEYTVWFGRIE